MVNFKELEVAIQQITKNEELTVSERLENICAHLQSSVAHYDWVGFYFHHEEKPELHLKAFAGEPTDHTVIPFGKGICGQVAESKNNFIVPDVQAQDNYIACSINVKSEIVVPLLVDGKNIGQIDIDSNTIDAFDKKDEQFLELVNRMVASILA